MKNYRQHGTINCFEHSFNVAYYSYKIAKFLKLDYKSLTRGAMLHDFFLYDWRDTKDILPKGFFNMHAFSHGKIAYNNASKLFKLNDIEKEVIIKNMWPVTISLPKYKETYIITLADKYSTLKEMIDPIMNKIMKSEMYNLLLCFIYLIVVTYDNYL